ncbi:LacI family DNA-binding transcriptional regulator [Microlunatus soli]|uniref:DNA-binding transcriptional regulator, LacI/PurR family n=1 Tax=Microlunatus soli TaxID=630515 RepID=A0A1H1YLJ1_9ACTN|nr:LacI family DNA-binding transcriptional regulator [Microlunatus soli]SDT22327.1 DNA-binding transcriptional regulator, LacI/PurR family [Microlunatus soli]
MTERRPKRPTISDVAELAGVSKGAVSRSFNGAARLSPATVERIRAAAAELGWMPSAAARAINGAPAHAIGVVLRRPPELLELDPFFAAFLAGAEGVFAAQGYAVILRFVDTAEDERDCYRQLVAERRVDGFLINDLRQPDFRFKLLEEMGQSAVVVGRPGARCPFPSVDSDSDAAVESLLQHLIESGHRIIGHVSGSPSLQHSRHRVRLWRDTLQANGLPAGPLAVGHFTAAGGAAATDELLRQQERPTAIFYGNDVMAVAGLAMMSDRGLVVPDDVAVAGFDGVSIASYTSPPLTTVQCNYRAVGHAAADLLLNQIAGERAPHRVLVPAELRLRRSTGASAQ